MLVLTLIIHHKLNTRYNTAQYKFPVPVQLIEVLKMVAVCGYTLITTHASTDFELQRHVATRMTVRSCDV